MSNKAKSVYDVCYTICAIIICIALGELIYAVAGGLPPSLYGMITFTILLRTKWINDKRIDASIRWIIANMGVCFVPAGVGIIQHYELIAKHGISIVLITFVTTFILLTAVGISYQKSIDKTDKNRL
jgi:holin-like protein